MNQPGTPDNATLRVFIGVACPPSARITVFLHELQSVACKGESGIRVVDEGNLHITLKFLGSVAQTCSAEIAEALDQIVTEVKPFEISLAGAGIFQEAFWLGLRPSQQLYELALLINQRLHPLGFAPETRPFIPHLTVARIKQRSRRDIDSLLQQCSDEVWGSLEVERIHLYRSITLPAGVRYLVMHTAEFPRSLSNSGPDQA